jgi:uncharacterized protein
MSPKWIYLHGFASGPRSRKGVAIAAHFARRGVEVERLNQRLPSLEELRLSVMMRAVREAIGGDRDRAVLIGSSLGGLTAARVAEEDPRVCALVLLAPAFRFVERWRARLGEAGFAAWQAGGWLDITDYTDGSAARVDFGFVRDVEAIDARSEGWPDVRVPTLIVHGRADTTVSIELSRTWARGKRHVRLVEVDDDHELLLAMPVITDEAERFLRSFLGT